jgi:hypothetical protein
MKLFVGTLYSGENEFEECLDSIQKQQYKNFDHYVFKNLPNKEAHATLFQSFLDKTDEYDVLVKVDADMVLTNEAIFGYIVEKLETNDWIEIFSIAVLDFFTDQLIWGLDTYRNTVRWDFSKETLFVDYPEVTKERICKDDKEWAPAAIHCKNPSLLQAFHYGVHRGLKSLEPGRGDKHWDLLDQVWINFQRTQDVRIGFACLGRELVYRGLFGISDLDYTRSKVKEVLDEYVSFDVVRLNNEIRKVKLLNWGILPGSIRRKLLRFLNNHGEF